MAGRRSAPFNKGLAAAWKQMKRERAFARNTAFAALTPVQKLESLDKRLGKDQGAAKQRRRLHVDAAIVVAL